MNDRINVFVPYISPFSVRMSIDVAISDIPTKEASKILELLQKVYRQVPTGCKLEHANVPASRSEGSGL